LQFRVLARLARGKAGEALRLIKEKDALKNRDEVLNALEKEMSIEEVFKLTTKWANYERKELERILDIILFWFRDILILKQGEEGRLINYDKIKGLKKQKKKYSLKEIRQIMETIEKTRYYLKNNVSQKLALEALWLKLKEDSLKNRV